MREIKFRAWDKIDEKMKNVECIFFHSKGNIVKAELFELLGDEYEFTERFLEDIILLPYTGLKDNNYKEIYEGDIIVCHAENWDYIGVVEYDETYDTGSYVLAQTRKSNNEIVDLIMPRFTGDPKEVIGNIYENPELLEVINEK